MSLKEQNFGPFRLVRELGRGATGTVYLAEQTTLGRECALKVLAPELVRDQSFLERFRREGRIAAGLRHKGIVRIFDLVECEAGFALAMDYIEGRELQELLNSEAAIPQNVALDIVGQVLEALEYAHGKGVVHRDIKPANILLEPDGSVYLTDFSIARMAGSEKLTQTGMVIGTPEYMAPEQFDGKEIDARADIYATALILYEMLSGSNPFRGETLAEVVKKQVLVEPPSLSLLPGVSEGLSQAVHKGLQKEPSQRYQSAGEMRTALLALGEQPAPTVGGSLTQFLSSVELGAISMDDAVAAREKVKDAIDRGFKRELTIVMLDLAGSSKIKIPNQTLIADRAFQDYRGTINRILEEYGVERYEWSGDGAISLFPNPIGAVDAAVKVQRSVAQVGSRHTALPDALKVRIGIRTGMVYYDPRRTLGEFASRTVDQAGHLEKDCPPGAIRLGDTTVQALNGRYRTVSRGLNRDDIEVFEIEAAELGSPPDVSTETNELPSPTPVPTPAPVPLFTPSGDYDRSKERAPNLGPSTNPVSLPASVTTEASTPVKALFRPKTGEMPVAKTVRPETVEIEVEEEEGAWWGWRSFGLLGFLWAGALFLREGLGVDIPARASGLIGAFYVLHFLMVPVYCVVCLFANKTSRAKEALVAGGVFLMASILFLAGLQDL